MAPPAERGEIWSYDTGAAGPAQISRHPEDPMAIQLALMIEGQEGLTWERWQALARIAEATRYAALFRSDHLTGLFGDSRHASLDTWASLTWLATATRRIRFGPLVCPLTFYHPALLAKRAAAVAELSGGRLDLGLGAGWHEGEHAMFGIAFPPLRERMDRLECGARAIRALWQGRPVTLEQPYYPLREAQSFPLPPGGGVPLIVGGRGERRTLRIVAEHADEWNVTRVTVEEYGAKCRVLQDHCRAVGRDPAAIRRSLMVPILTGRTAAEVDTRRARARAIFPRLPEDAAGWHTAGFLHGTVDEVRRDLQRWEKAGVSRAMLQILDMTDLDMIQLIGEEVAAS
jgi:alkanesulfonate monooxygenase SsuD/methylene tetrahydromethanopterin reductase-like flavin-dependent oxidoreductase (luciferase family)